MKNTNFKKIGFYVYSYHQAKEVLHESKKQNLFPFIAFKYYIIDNLGILWIKEISKLLLKNYKKNDVKIILDCNKNPAIAVNCIANGFSYIIFKGNKILQKKIYNIGKQHKVTINPKIKIIDLKRVNNCKKYINKMILK